MGRCLTVGILAACAVPSVAMAVGNDAESVSRAIYDEPLPPSRPTAQLIADEDVEQWLDDSAIRAHDSTPAAPLAASYHEPFGAEPIGDDFDPEAIPFAEDAMVDSDVVPANAYYAEYLDAGMAPPMPTGRSLSWLTGPYFKSGVTFVLGDGIFDDNQETRYAISFGGRQALFPAAYNGQLFLDLGGSFLSAVGTRTRNVQARETDNMGNVAIIDDAYSITLEKLKRSGAHAGLGMYFGSPIDDRRNDPQARLAFTVGGRLSHFRGVFESDFILDEDDVDDTATYESLYANSDSSGGIYVSTEAILLRRGSPVGDLHWTVNGEIAHDWVQLPGFDSRGLATASVLFGFMIAR